MAHRVRERVALEALKGQPGPAEKALDLTMKIARGFLHIVQENRMRSQRGAPPPVCSVTAPLLSCPQDEAAADADEVAALVVAATASSAQLSVMELDSAYFADLVDAHTHSLEAMAQLDALLKRMRGGPIEAYLQARPQHPSGGVRAPQPSRGTQPAQGAQPTKPRIGRVGGVYDPGSRRGNGVRRWLLRGRRCCRCCAWHMLRGLRCPACWANPVAWANPAAWANPVARLACRTGVTCDGGRPAHPGGEPL